MHCATLLISQAMFCRPCYCMNDGRSSSTNAQALMPSFVAYLIERSANLAIRVFTAPKYAGARKTNRLFLKSSLLIVYPKLIWPTLTANSSTVQIAGTFMVENPIFFFPKPGPPRGPELG